MICCVWTVSTSPELSLAAHCLRLVTCILTQMVYSDKIHCFQVKFDFFKLISSGFSGYDMITSVHNLLAKDHTSGAELLPLPCKTGGLCYQDITNAFYCRDNPKNGLNARKSWFMDEERERYERYAVILVDRAVDYKSFSQHVA